MLTEGLRKVLTPVVPFPKVTRSEPSLRPGEERERADDQHGADGYDQQSSDPGPVAARGERLVAAALATS